MEWAQVTEGPAELGTSSCVLCPAASSRVYHRLESLAVDADEAEVSREFLRLLGADRLGYLSLIHQLIVCEENLNAA